MHSVSEKLGLKQYSVEPVYNTIIALYNLFYNRAACWNPVCNKKYIYKIEEMWMELRMHAPL